MKKQTTASQKGEINFRRKLVRQQINGEKIFDDEFDSEGIKKLLEEWMKETYQDMKGLKDKVISPYLEIGAERCQRTLVLENDMGMRGAATDLSFDMLKACRDYSRIFKKKRIPLRICCDAYNLPFARNSMPFVFCYHTLHHFPDPEPILHEIYDVLSPGGCFFMGNEPYKKILHMDIYKSRKRYSKRSLDANFAKKALDYFFSYRPCNETEHGIIENEGIPLQRWEKLAGIFDRSDIKMKFLKRFRCPLSGKGGPKFLLGSLAGGAVAGTLCKKGKAAHAKSIESSLICPQCKTGGREAGLVELKDQFVCGKCKRRYPIIEGVVILLNEKKCRELYPEISMKYSNKGREHIQNERT